MCSPTVLCLLPKHDALPIKLISWDMLSYPLLINVASVGSGKGTPPLLVGKPEQ
jgi:hypothetical protein